MIDQLDLGAAFGNALQMAYMMRGKPQGNVFASEPERAPAYNALAAGGGPTRAAAAMDTGDFDFSPYLVGGGTREDAISGLAPEFSGALAALYAAAPEDIRSDLYITSAYRSPEVQARLWGNALEKYGSPEAARKWVAPPGKSNHNGGGAVDFKYGSDAAKRWAHENAPTYGLHFPMSWEPWHVELAGSRG